MTNDHLDADELNAYAESALPTSARTRYASHLADCVRCRRLVSQLALASHLEAEGGGKEAVTRPPLLHNSVDMLKFVTEALAGFFGAVTWRYAAAGMAAAAIIVIGFFVARNRQRDTLVALNQQPAFSTNGTYQGGRTNEANISAGANRPDASEEKSSRLDGIPSKPEPMPSNSTRDATDTTRLKKEKTGALDASVEKSKDSPKAAAIQNQPSASAPATTTANPERIEGPSDAPERREEQLSRQIPEKSARNEPRQDDAEHKEAAGGRLRSNSQTAAAAGSTSSVSSTKGIPSRRAETNRDESRDGRNAAAPPPPEKRRAGSLSTSETSVDKRRLSGHTFTRQGSVWVDTAFDASGHAKTLKRGSREYRALLADEPSVGTVAEELAGDILLEWKGRFYHIK